MRPCLRFAQRQKIFYTLGQNIGLDVLVLIAPRTEHAHFDCGEIQVGLVRPFLRLSPCAVFLCPVR